MTDVHLLTCIGGPCDQERHAIRDEDLYLDAVISIRSRPTLPVMIDNYAESMASTEIGNYVISSLIVEGSDTLMHFLRHESKTAANAITEVLAAYGRKELAPVPPFKVFGEG